jgi:tRNA(fMet)-specific endonuclease VapC
MILLDTDTLTLYLNNHIRVIRRLESASEEPAISIVSRIEVLQGRFASVVKAANSEELLRFQERLLKADRELLEFTIVPFDKASAREFDRLRHSKKHGRMGRNDLLIACIALANHATLVTRNVKDFRSVPGLRLENGAD